MRFPSQFGSKSKTWFLHGARLLLWALPFAFVSLTFAQTDGGTSFSDILGGFTGFLSDQGLAQVVFRVLMAILVLIIGGVLGAITLFCTTIMQNALLNAQNSIILSDAIGNAWQILLSGSNVLFFLALTIFAVMIIIGAQNYNLKKAISGVVYAFIAANLSFEIVHLFVNLGDSLQFGIREAFIQLGGLNPYDRLWGFFAANAQMPAIFADIFSPQGVSTGVAETVQILVLSVGFIVSQAVTAYVAIRLVIILAERAIRLALLIVFAPLIFVLQLFPGAGLNNLSQNWWGDLIKWVLVLPTVYLLMGIAGILLPADPTSIAEKFAAAMGVGTGQPIDTNIWTDPMLIVAAIAVLYAASNATGLLKLGSEGLDLLGKPLDKLLGSYGEKAKVSTQVAFNKAQLRAAEGNPVFNEGGRFGNLAALGNAALGGNKIGRGLAQVGVWLRTKSATSDRNLEVGKETLGKQKSELLAKQDWKEDRANQDYILKLSVEEGQAQGTLGANATKYDFLNLSDDDKGKITKIVSKKNPQAFDKLIRGIINTAKANETQAEKDFKSSKPIGLAQSELEESLNRLIPYLEGQEPFSQNIGEDINKIGANMYLLDEYIQKGTQEQKDRARDLKNQFLVKKYGREAFEIATRRQPYYATEQRRTGEGDPRNTKRLAEIETTLTEPTYSPANISRLENPIRRAALSQGQGNELINAINGSGPLTLRLMITDSNEPARLSRLNALNEYETFMSSQRSNSKGVKNAITQIKKGPLVDKIKSHEANILRDEGVGPSPEKFARWKAVLTDIIKPTDNDGAVYVEQLAELKNNDFEIDEIESSRILGKSLRDNAVAVLDANQAPTTELKNLAKTVETKKQLEADRNQLRDKTRKDYGDYEQTVTTINELKKTQPQTAGSLFFDKTKEERLRYFRAVRSVDDNTAKNGRVMDDIYQTDADRVAFKAYADEIWDTLGESRVKVLFPYITDKPDFSKKIKSDDWHKLMSIIQDSK